MSVSDTKRADTTVIDSFRIALDSAEDTPAPPDELRKYLERKFGLDSVEILIKNDSTMDSILNTESTETIESYPRVNDVVNRDSIWTSNGITWVPVHDRAGLLGVIAFSAESWNDEYKSDLDSILPFWFAHFERTHQYESALRHELVDFRQRITPSLEHIQTNQGIDDFLHSLVESISLMFECDNCRLFWRNSPDTLVLRSETQSTVELGTEIRIHDDPIIERVITEEKSVIINDLPDHSGERPGSGTVRSFMSVPFRYEDTVLGTINLSSQTRDVYTKEDLERLSALCDNLSATYAITQEFVDLTEYIEQVLANLPVGIVNFQFDQDRILLNREAQEVLFTNQETLSRVQLKKHIEENISNGSKLKDFILSPELDDSEEYQEVKFESRESAKRRVVKINRTIIRNSDGVLSGIIVVLSDITEEHRLNRQVNRTERLAALGELASSLAHEIKNPLTSIQGFVQMLPKRVGDDEFLEKTSEILNKECRRVNSLIENLLSFSKPQIGHETEFKLHNLLDDVTMLINKRLQEQEISYEIDVSDEMTLYGDASKIKQVLMNLVLNALDAMSDGGTLEIDCQENDQGYQVIRVSDDGPGMEESTQRKIFNPFFTTKEDGTGLGMAITHRIVEEHGGIIRVDSEIDEGTTITIALPTRDLRETMTSEVNME